MATDATGAPTSLGIPKYNTSVDPPSGKGFNAAMDSIDTLVTARIANPVSKSTNQALVWNGTSWVAQSLVDANISAGAAIAYSKLNLTGAVLNADLAGSIVPGKLTAGTDRQVLANSGGTNQWQASNFSGDTFITAPASGDYILPYLGSCIATGGSNPFPALNSVMYVPIQIPGVTTTWDAIRFTINTLGAGNTLRCGVYASTTRGAPGNLIVEFGTVSGATTGVKTVVGTPTTISGNTVVYLALVSQGGTAAQFGGYATNQVPGVSNGAWNGITFPVIYFTQAGVSGALPATATPVAVTADGPPSAPYMGLRKA